MDNNVLRVMLTSYDADDTKSDNFLVMQEFIPSTRILKTTTKTGDADPSELFSWVNEKGNVIRTLDSSITYVSTTVYQYDDLGNLLSLSSLSYDSSKKNPIKEEHIWQYESGKIKRMLRIKNGSDTSFVEFKFDDNGNIIEEAEVKKGTRGEPVYYYYDRQNRLTDVVRYNVKARKLLPEYMFEYSPANQVIQKITVPSNSDKYLIWRYQFNAQGLKIKEAIYDKDRDLMGKVEYEYSFGN